MLDEIRTSDEIPTADVSDASTPTGKFTREFTRVVLIPQPERPRAGFVHSVHI
jgi:hypothetical protein